MNGMKVRRWDAMYDRDGKGEYKFMYIIKYILLVVGENMIMRENR